MWLYILYGNQRFPDWDGALPVVPSGVTICRTELDLGPATKILPAARDLRGSAAQIQFCDDDSICDEGWSKNFFDIQDRRHCEAVAVYVWPAQGYVLTRLGNGSRRRAKQLPVEYDGPYRFSRLLCKILKTKTFKRRPFVVPAYGEIFFGVAGVVVRPESFDDLACDIPAESWAVDDVWLSANLARLGIRIYCPWMAALTDAAGLFSQDELFDAELCGESRQEVNRAAAALYQQKFEIWTS